MGRSASALQTRAVDRMQVHKLLEWRTHMPTLRAMKERGDIRYIGITHYTSAALDDLRAVIEAEPAVDFVQLAHSIGVRDAEARFLPFAAARGVAVLAHRPYEGGSVSRTIGRASWRDRGRPYVS